MVKRTNLTKEVATVFTNLENEYGSMAIRAALWNIVGEGYSAYKDLTDEKIEAQYQRDLEKEKSQTTAISLMTPEFKRDILKITQQIVKLNIADILKYIQNEIVIA